MRILLAGDYPPDPTLGSTKVIVKLQEEFRALGHDCDVLLAPHHGSEQSDPPGFAAWCRPEEVVMSGRRPTRPLSSQVSYEQAGARVHHTAQTGAVTCLLSAEGVEVSQFRAAAARRR